MVLAQLNSVDAPPSPRPSPLFSLWERADRLVPMPFLYCWLARAPQPAFAAGLHHLRHVDFIYSVGNGFVAHLVGRNGDFSPAVLARDAPRLQLVPVNRRQCLVTPEAAEQAIESHLSRQRPEFWRELFHGSDAIPTDFHELDRDGLVERFHAVAWQSLRLDRPLRAGQLEASYRFRKVHCRCEFVVGATSGLLRVERLPQSPAAPGQPDPS